MTVIVLTLVIAACTVQKRSGVMGAAVAPLNDLNIVRTKIPDVLLNIQKKPYVLPENMSCVSLGRAINALDAVLGPDLDVLAMAGKPGMIQRGSNAAGAAAVGVLRNTTEGVLPFRGWIRKLTGAERYSRQVAAAIAAGMVRRAFLKGLCVSRKCV